MGGRLVFTPPQGALGTITPAAIDDSSASPRYFAVGGATYTFDANDVFQYQGVAITQAQFEALLGSGTTVGGSYNPSAAGVSTFNVTLVTENAPTTTAAELVNLDAGAFANDVRVVVAGIARSGPSSAGADGPLRVGRGLQPRLTGMPRLAEYWMKRDAGAFCNMRTRYLRNVPDEVVERLERGGGRRRARPAVPGRRPPAGAAAVLSACCLSVVVPRRLAGGASPTGCSWSSGWRAQGCWLL